MGGCPSGSGDPRLVWREAKAWHRSRSRWAEWIDCGESEKPWDPQGKDTKQSVGQGPTFQEPQGCQHLAQGETQSGLLQSTPVLGSSKSLIPKT